MDWACCAYAGQFERAFVNERSVTAGVCQNHRVVGRNTRQLIVDRIAFHGIGRRHFPLLLVPAAAADPGILPGIARRGAHLAANVIPTFGRGQVQDHLGSAQAHVVAVTLNEAR